MGWRGGGGEVGWRGGFLKRCDVTCDSGGRGMRRCH